MECERLGFHGARLNPCGFCVGGSTGLEPGHGRDCKGSCGGRARRDCHGVCGGSAYLDPCSGNCLCERDVCGVCNGRGSSCFLLTGITPAVVPADVDVKITLLGAFSGETRDVLCVFRRRDAAVVGGSTEPTTVTAAGRGNGTSFTCLPRSFQQGTYLVTPRLSRLGKEVNNSNVILTVFNKDVGFDKMEPTTAPYRKEENKGESLRLVFTGGDVPKFPLYCILQPTERSQRPTVVPPSVLAPASHSQCHVPFQKTSGDFVVFPSLDGQHPLSRGFNLSLYATRPQIKAAYITGDGEKLRLSLNSDMVTEDKQSVVMNIGEDLKVDARRVAPPNPGPLLAAISGPTVAPRCGRLELTVHYSWGAGPVEAFAWTATRNDSAPLEDHLKALLKANSGPYLILEAEDLEMEMQYKFTVKVTADTRNTAEAAHLLTRRDVNAPIVVLYSDAILNQRPVSPEDELFLYAETVVPDCNGTLDDLELDWTVDDPRVRFDFGSQNSPVYRIAPYALPPDSNVTFQVRAFSYPTQWAYGESSVTLSVGSSDLKAVIKGGPSRMAGQGQNDVILNGSPSSGGQDPLVYQWSCLDEHLQPCYDYGPTATSDLLLKPLETNREVIRIMAERLEPGKSLNFTLEVFRTDNSSGEPGVKAATSTLVITQEEIIPLAS
ncbi:hypothetical protein IscW_ISCW020659 [Ixodes scapularis]|uniref:PKD/REJ-like domain-containing protein n=1 Tax=Ixodes scapularis TaxID=6945 RepID=B7Q2Q2_IXOSC|nr:hypothetical protein IscW_ISCW020659 [Ixodes scapularis]|eukprot:XP_002410932.1 hypothetical protein IscW_ISCW020659 [Ixodes scapularis]